MVWMNADWYIHVGRLCSGPNVNGQGVQPSVDENLQSIIHKPVLCHTRTTSKSWTANRNSEVGTAPCAIGAGVSRMCCTVVNDIQYGGGQHFNQPVGYGFGGDIFRTHVHG